MSLLEILLGIAVVIAGLTFLVMCLILYHLKKDQRHLSDAWDRHEKDVLS